MSLTEGKLDIILALLDQLAYAWCASSFLTRYLQSNELKGRLFGSLLFFCRAVMALLFENSNVPYILSAMCSHGILIGLTLAVFEGEKEKKILAAIILSAATGLIWSFTESILTFGGLIFLHITAGSRGIEVIRGWPEKAIPLITSAVGIVSITWLSKLLPPVFHHKRKSWYLLAGPFAFILLTVDLVNWAASNGIMVHDWGKYGLYENQLFSHGAVCMFTGLAMTAVGCYGFGLERMDREEKAGEEYRIQVMYYQMMEKQYSQMECLRHDTKNHILALENLVQNRQWEKAKSYLHDMAGIGGMETGDEVTGSFAMDALLYHKKRRALESGVRWQCDARLSADIPIKEIDLCIIMGNLLDNAIEACEHLENEEKFIRIRMVIIKRCLLLEVENSIHQASSDPAKSFPQRRTWKKDPEKHGIGLMNVRAAAANYHGAVQMETELGVFSISVLLPFDS